MLNAKSVAMQIVADFNPEWVEEFFGSAKELVEELVLVLNQFDSVADIKSADEADFFVNQNEGGLYSFRNDILRAYGLK